MLTIYTEHITARLSYIAETLFTDLLGCPVVLTTQLQSSPKGAWLNYSNKELAGIPFIRPTSLLFEQGIRDIGAEMYGDGLLFKTASDLADHDVLAASFYLISRYEEYLTTERDAHGRFQAESSLMYRHAVLDRPLIDEWVMTLYAALRRRYPELPGAQREFHVVPTFDIDVAYCYLGRSAWRQLRSTFLDLIRLDSTRRRERSEVLSGEKPDNYDSYSYQRRIVEQSGSISKHFFLLGDYGPNDKNLSHRSTALRELIRDVSEWSEVGIHPSYGSHKSVSRLKKEIGRLKRITGKEVTSSRQHYLKFSLPETYRRLISCGVKEDHSMSFAQHVGFRAGTCSTFRWYDLEAEEISPLYVTPLAVMDSTLKDYMSLSPNEAKETMYVLRDNIEKVKGTMVILWHNHSAARQGAWIGWRGVLEAGLFGK